MRRLVVLISAATAMVQRVAFGKWSGKGTGEMGLLVSLFEELKASSSWIRILVADRYYCSYMLIAVLAHFDIRFVTRLHGRRLIDFADAESVQRKRNGDFHVTWCRPQRPFWMLDWMWEIVPKTMTLRLVRVRIDTEGARTRGFFVVTNLRDDVEYPSEAIRQWYRGRWQVEVDLRTIKTFMSMEVPRGKTPDMMDREFAMGLLAYNLVRAKMLETAVHIRERAKAEEESGATKKDEAKTVTKTKTTKNKIAPEEMLARNVSFSVALTGIVSGYMTIHFMSEAMREIYRNTAESNRGSVQVGNRPDRVEPRCKKRRPKPHRLMTEPREALRAQLKRGDHPTQDGDEASFQLGEH